EAQARDVELVADCGAPGLELRAARQRQVVQETAAEGAGERLQPVSSERLDVAEAEAAQQRRIEEDTAPVEVDRVAVGLEDAALAVLDDLADLGQAPAQRPAR